jgi:2-haloacid dehalogenase
MQTIVFDVNETLLDLRAMAAGFQSTFGSSDLLAPWFGQLLRHSLVATVTGVYRPFDELAIDALLLVAAKAEREISPATAIDIVDQMRHLPPHGDVLPALEHLSQRGFRIAALTNSPPAVLEDQLRNAGIDGLVPHALSVDPVGRFKPHPATYRSGAERLGIPVERMRLVAAHDWDVTGAIRAGARAAFVARPGMVLSEASEIPDIVGPDLVTVAEAIIAAER